MVQSGHLLSTLPVLNRVIYSYWSLIYFLKTFKVWAKGFFSKAFAVTIVYYLEKIQKFVGDFFLKREEISLRKMAVATANLQVSSFPGHTHTRTQLKINLLSGL